MNTKAFESRMNGLRESGVKFPVTLDQARRFRNVGPITLDWMAKHGLVISLYVQLSCRAANCLAGLGIRTKAEAKAAIQEGKLSTAQTRAYGWHTHKEVCKWVGLPVPAKGKKDPVTCPRCGLKF